MMKSTYMRKSGIIECIGIYNDDIIGEGYDMFHENMTDAEIVNFKDNTNDFYYIELEEEEKKTKKSLIKTFRKKLNFLRKKNITKSIHQHKEKLFLKIGKKLNKINDESNNKKTNFKVLTDIIKIDCGFADDFNDKTNLFFFGKIKPAIHNYLKTSIIFFLKNTNYKIKNGVVFNYNDTGDLIITDKNKKSSSSSKSV